MSYLVLCTFDLVNASSEDYEKAYTAFSKIGFFRTLTATDGSDVFLPNTTVAGFYKGASVKKVRDDLSDMISSLFNNNRLVGRFLVVVSDDYAWAERSN